MGIPYGMIADIIIVGVCVVAFWTAETAGKVIIVAIIGLLFFLPSIFSFFGQFGIFFFIGRIIFGIICFLYIKYKGII